jgi:hypothetical protein
LSRSPSAENRGAGDEILAFARLQPAAILGYRTPGEEGELADKAGTPTSERKS